MERFHFLDQTTRYLFFTGKGGVGKTTLSSATAVALADRGIKILLVSTDPASNLDDVLGMTLNASPTPVPGVDGLWAANLDPEQAAATYRDKAVGPYRGILPESAVASMEEQLSGACTVEIAAFDEFARLLDNRDATQEFDHIVFDTAPTGHTLRLLSLPSAWQGFIDTASHGASCLGPLAGLQQQRALYETAVSALKDPTMSTLFLVSRLDHPALKEAARASGELADLGITNQRLLLNGVFQASAPDDPIARSFQERGAAARARMPARLSDLPTDEFPLVAHNLIGVAALRQMVSVAQPQGSPGSSFSARQRSDLPPPLLSLVDRLAAQKRGAVMTMGKGGVGKTTVAAAIAIELASRGHLVHLTTTDPAAHLSDAVAEEVVGLQISRIDPKAEVIAYTAEVLRTAGQGLDSEGRALLEEDLRSPCTEEIAVFRAFARAVDAAQEGFVILDTAPTGHTILLLDAAEAYNREVSKKASGVPDAVRLLLPRLRDADYTQILLVTLPEATPVAEAERLQEDLRRAAIEPFGWVINQSLSGVTTADLLLQQRAAEEAPFIQRVKELSQHVFLVPWGVEAPVGPGALKRLVRS